MDWMAFLESVAFVASGTVLGAGISFLSQMITVKTQGQQLEKQLTAEKERTETTLRAERQSQLREKQLGAVAEVAALLEVAFKQADNKTLSALSDELPPGYVSEYQLARDLARNATLLPRALRKAANETSQAIYDYGMSILVHARDSGLGTKVDQEPQRRVELVLEFAWEASKHEVIERFKAEARAGLSAFQWAANAFSNDTQPVA